MKGLEGVKVVELTGYVAAPAALRVLGEMGATIYKVEPLREMNTVLTLRGLAWSETILMILLSNLLRQIKLGFGQSEKRRRHGVCNEDAF